MRPHLPSSLALAACIALASACAETGTFGTDIGRPADHGATGAEPTSTADLSRREIIVFPDKTLIYAHTDTELFKADPTVKPIALTSLGSFDCIGGTGQDPTMTDLAVDKDGNLFGVSASAVYRLELQSSAVHCASTWTLQSASHFYGLTFAPAGVLGAQDVLVAANSAGELWAIDSTGSATEVGTFGLVPTTDGHGHTYPYAGKAWELSGDIVFLANQGKPLGFATVRDCPSPPDSKDCDSIDTLVEIDVPALKLGNTASVTKSVRGQVLKSAGCSDPSTAKGYGSMYGVAAWNDKVYGFSRSGNLVEISNVDGTACLVQSYADYKFAGAGVTTVAPVKGPE